MTVPVQSVPDEQSVDPSADAPAAAPAAVPAVQAPVIPDRADSPVTEVAERFLRAIVAQVPLERIEELHLFSPLRQGTVETGIAVLAARVPVAVVVEPVADEVSEAPEQQLSLSESSPEPTENSDENAAADDDATPFEDAAVVMTEAVIAAAGDDDEEVSPTDAVPAELSADEDDEAAAMEAVTELLPVDKVRLLRHTVFTARYRYVIKGPERGKWESSIKAEAEAPLITVETVVRGVQRRAGEESEIVRYSAAQIARALRLPFPA